MKKVKLIMMIMLFILTTVVGYSNIVYVDNNYGCYPNPASTHIYIYIDNDNADNFYIDNDNGDNYYIQIISLLGQEVFNQTISQQSFYIDINDLATGVYFIHIRKNGVLQSRTGFIKN